VAERQLWALLVVHEMITRAGVLAANELLSVPEMSQASPPAGTSSSTPSTICCCGIFAAPALGRGRRRARRRVPHALPDDEPLFAALRRKAACARRTSARDRPESGALSIGNRCVAVVWVATGSFGGDEFADGGGDPRRRAPDEVGGLAIRR